MKFFNSLMLLAVLFAGSFSVNAQDVSGEVRVQSAFLDRGWNLSERPYYFGEDAQQDPVASYGATFRLDNVGVDGLFIEADFDSVKGDFGNKRSDVLVRQEIELGYGYSFDKLDLQGSVAHVRNSAFYSFRPYNEVRLDATYNVTDKFRLKGEAARVFASGNLPSNVYYSGGAEYDLTDKFTIGGLVSAYHYEAVGTEIHTDKTQYVTSYNPNYNVRNNTQLYAKYSLNDSFELRGAYSFGGSDLIGRDLSNEWTVGVAYTF